MPSRLHQTFLGLVLAGLLVSLLSSGCGRYQLGRHVEPPFRSIYIKPVSNTSFAPQAQAILSLQLREDFLLDGLVLAAHEGDADAILEITLRNFDRQIAATRQDDTEIAEKIRLALSASCTLLDRRTGRVYFKDRPVSATADSFPDDRSQQAQYQSMPVLTRNLARRISYEVLQVW